MVRQQHRDGWAISGEDTADAVLTAAMFGLVRVPVLMATRPAKVGLEPAVESAANPAHWPVWQQRFISGATGLPGAAQTTGCSLVADASYCGRMEGAWLFG